MKKLLVIICIAGLISCGGNDNKKGLELISKSDCATCHKETETAIGPAYEAIANRYAATTQVTDTLSQNIIKGSSGRWGNVPMPPHLQLTNDDAQQMVKYILSLKK